MSAELSTLMTDQKPTVRRGRPRKHPITELKPLQPVNHSPTPEQPREERSYKDFYPDLDIKEPLALISREPSTEPPSDDFKQLMTVSTLPIPRFQKINDKHDQQCRHTKQDDDEDGLDLHSHFFHRPKNHYIRYIEPSEKELFEMVEYDMDEQDEAWLKIYNKERKKENVGQISCELFEAIIDKLEKEWFNLVKNLPKKPTEEPLLPEDSKCAVCDDGECENSNAIVFCDGCNLAVHQDCYGIPYIPEGQWLCRKCMISPENPVSCIFCPFEGGAFKQTTTNQWAHLLCAIWIPEVTLSNSVYMEPIDNIALIPKSRWKLTCYICRRRRHHSACIQCDNKHCFVAFHVTCARWARLCMRMKLLHHHDEDESNDDGNHDSSSGVVLKAYCDRHTPRDYKEQVDVERMVAMAQNWFADQQHKRIMPQKRYVDEEDKEENTNEFHGEEQMLLLATKAARAHQHQYTAGAAPIAPEYIIHKLENLPHVKQASRLKKKAELIESICRYWSLKRESRRGAPLLKRLHLEPWTASASQLKQTEVEKAHKASSMMSLRADLEKVRMLSEQVQKRERQKLERIRKQKAYLETILYPLEHILQGILEQLIETDKREFFRYPVTPDIAPDYNEIIESPMSFSIMQEKMVSHQYMTIEEFEADLQLIWKNCMTYNQTDTIYYKAAQKLDKLTNELITQAQYDYKGLKIVPETGILDIKIDPNIFTYGKEKKSTTVENKDNSQLDVLDSISSSLSSEEATLSNNNNSSSRKKRAISIEDDEESRKKRRTSPKEKKKKAIRIVTRSMTERNKRELRSRTIDKDPIHSSISNGIHLTSLKKKRRRATMSSPCAVQEEKPTIKKENDLVPDIQKDRLTSSSPSTTTTTITRSRSSTPRSLTPRSSTPVTKKKVEFKDGEIVWARVRGFPPHPAMIVDPSVTNKTIPENVLSLKPPHQILVQFFLVGDSHTWGWIDKSEIHVLGDLDTDIDMLLQTKKSKKSYRIREVKNGYRHVCYSLLQIDPQIALTSVFKQK
ncbi:uncharacterized protein BX663DRAFT_499491 [Cokeromyces recurvatus]|uniref:uncharacterized protein n=1 Tax=Cokeromyces recurvatus TaxID=90255 RepID=UPI00221FB2E9|nr:uncharacterized protein BX663DRAFT_499491 [Cokeromyces recurvatus]KAI7905371.1 hypothetical protein BX663DRAFT_499491 [Cokeromyces recurvatus]